MHLTHSNGHRAAVTVQWIGPRTVRCEWRHLAYVLGGIWCRACADHCRSHIFFFLVLYAAVFCSVILNTNKIIQQFS